MSKTSVLIMFWELLDTAHQLVAKVLEILLQETQSSSCFTIG